MCGKTACNNKSLGSCKKIRKNSIKWLGVGDSLMCFHSYLGKKYTAWEIPYRYFGVYVWIGTVELVYNETTAFV